MRRADYLEQRREQVRRDIDRLGVKVERLPSGMLRLTGKLIDFKVRDLADVLPHDLEPSRW